MGLVQKKIFDVVPDTNHLGFFEKTKGILAKEVVDFLELRQEDVSKVAGIPKASVRYDNKIPNELKQRILEIAVIAELVAGYFKGDVEKTTIWFKLPNPMLGDISPRDMIRFGRFEKLRKYIINALPGENP